MADNVDNINSQIASVIFSDPNTNHITGEDYALLLSYQNISLGEWEGAYDWECLHNDYNVLVSASTGNASIALPQDFRKPSANPLIAGSEYTITRPQDQRKYLESDNRVAFYGNPRVNYTLRVFGATLASGASITIPYYRSAGSLATSTDIAPIPDSTYLVRRSIALWYEGHEDARFLNAKLDAERILGNLIDYENVFPEGSNESRVRSVDEVNNRFRPGED